MRTSSGELELYRTGVKSEWVDYNGHMSEAFYVLVFGFASDAFYERIGLWAPAAESSQVSVYTAEAHIMYLQEIAEGEPLRVTTRVLDFDQKRIHALHTMYHGDEPKVLATEELMLIHVQTAPEVRTKPFAPDVESQIRALYEAQAGLDWPRYAGRSIGISRKH
jgi:acyl-CoA thioester hydrolase